MLRKKSPLLLLLAFLLLGSGCSNAPSSTSPKDLSDASSGEEFTEIMNARIDQVLKGWKSADGPARLVLIQEDLKEACDEFAASIQLSQYFEGMSTEDVKSLLGNPDVVDEKTLHYYLGTTTKATGPGNRDILSVEIEDGVSKGSYLELK